MYTYKYMTILTNIRVVIQSYRFCDKYNCIYSHYSYMNIYRM